MLAKGCERDDPAGYRPAAFAHSQDREVRLMSRDGDRAELNPAITWGVIAVVVLIAVAVGFKFLGGAGGGEFQKGGSEALMKKVQSGQPLYQPPAAGLPAAARGQAGASGGTPYNPPTPAPPNR